MQDVLNPISSAQAVSEHLCQQGWGIAEVGVEGWLPGDWCYKCLDRRCDSTSEYFRVQDDAGGWEQETDGMSEGEKEREQGDSGRQQQEESSNPRKEDDVAEQGDAERQDEEEEKSNARGERDAVQQEQE
ncbi:hypothetical protein NDU88_007689 [Pleurodeles waltl]|uniref:Uncharacterized protein n=1 Tax=Pleurodeles waltl TaxID=8319 RepID=A0AAV7VRI3_PLEWA|nr:hypothetical protein NDU88_007689 [Pleurodeles waltl]